MRSCILAGALWLEMVVLLLVSTHLECIPPPPTHLVRNPCQQVFEYRRRSDYYLYGLLTVPAPPLNDARVPLLATFVLRTRLPTKYGGVIELRRTQDETVRDILQRRPIQFIIHFPVQSPLPQLSLILFNNEILCSASDPIPNLSPIQPVYNRIDFRYTFNTVDMSIQELPISTARPSIVQNIGKSLASSIVISTTPNQRSTQLQETITMKPTITSTSTTTKHPVLKQRRCGQLHQDFKSSFNQSFDRGSWPWLTAIYLIRSSGPSFLCVGNLVSPTLVITAASCLTSRNSATQNGSLLHSDEMIIMLGRHNMSTWLESGTVVRKISTINIHPNYAMELTAEHRHNPYKNADIAVLLLEEPIQYGKFIMPVCLWNRAAAATDDRQDAMLGTVGTVVGWGVVGVLNDSTGHVRMQQTQITNTPESITISVVPIAFCGRPGGPDDVDKFCAGSRNGRRACVGDVGSGFIVLRQNRLALRGVMAGHSGGTPAATGCEEREYHIYTDVSAFADWIETFMD